MAASPVYGKQYIRFAETALAPATAIAQFLVVAADTSVSPQTDPATIKILAGAGEALGVIQQEFNAANSGLGTDLLRLATVATSGLLLVQASAATAPAVGAPLTVLNGVAVTAGTANAGAVTVNGTAPTVRQLVDIGGVSHALVSFA